LPSPGGRGHRLLEHNYLSSLRHTRVGGADSLRVVTRVLRRPGSHASHRGASDRNVVVADGLAEWGRNDDAECEAQTGCLLPLPTGT